MEKIGEVGIAVDGFCATCRVLIQPLFLYLGYVGGGREGGRYVGDREIYEMVFMALIYTFLTARVERVMW